MSIRLRLLVTVLLALVAAQPARAQSMAATVASAGGTVEVQRGGKGDWQPAMVGTSLFADDIIRTGAGSHGMLVFIDDGVVELGPNSELNIDQYGGPPSAKGPRRSLLRLARGTIEAIVSGYSAESDRFEVETPTAVVRVRSTRFIVRHDLATKTTDVIGEEGVVSVQGRTTLIGAGVSVGPNEITTVQQSKLPSEVRAVTDAERATILAGLGGPGTGSRDGLDVANPIVEGRVVRPEDRPEMAAAEARSGLLLKPEVPGETLIDTLSPDVRANTQPLPVYRAVPPNLSPQPPH